MVWGVRNLRRMISTASVRSTAAARVNFRKQAVAPSMFLDEFHAALGAFARHVLDYFRMH